MPHRFLTSPLSLLKDFEAITINEGVTQLYLCVWKQIYYTYIKKRKPLVNFFKTCFAGDNEIVKYI